MVHSTSKKAERAKQHTVAAIDWATALARKAGLPAPDSIIASSSKKKFMLFSIGLNDENSGADEEDHSECRVFGLITKPEASSSAMEDFLTAQY